MPALHVRDVDDAVIDALKKRAADHHRSLQGEIKAILENVAFPRQGGGKARRAPLRLRTVRVGGATTHSRDEIYGDDGR